MRVAHNECPIKDLNRLSAAFPQTFQHFLLITCERLCASQRGEFLQKNFVAGPAISLKCAVASPGAGVGRSRHRYNYDFERCPAGERATARQAALTMRHAYH